MEHLFRNNLKNNSGFSLIETLFYVTIIVLLFLVVVQGMISMIKAFRETTINASLTQGGAIMERMVREIRTAPLIVSISDTSLSINTEKTGGPIPVDFILSGTDLQIYENSVLIGNLNSSDVAVTDLQFDQITTTTGVAIKIAITLQSSKYGSTKEESFYDTIVLRSVY